MLTPTRASLRMRCWTERDTGGNDPYGGGEEWTPMLASRRCLWWGTSGREQTSDDRSVVIADEHLLIDHDADVLPGDRIVKVVDGMGRTVFDGQRRIIEHVSHGRQHVDCSLRAVT